MIYLLLVLSLLLLFAFSPVLIQAGIDVDPIPGQYRDKPHLQVNKGAKAPKPNKKQEKLQMQLMQAQLRQAQKKVKMPEIPTAPAIDPAPPPPSQTSADSLDAAALAKREARKRKNASSNTLLTGETGGYKANSLGGQKTLLA